MTPAVCVVAAQRRDAGETLERERLGSDVAGRARGDERVRGAGTPPAAASPRNSAMYPSELSESASPAGTPRSQ